MWRRGLESGNDIHCMTEGVCAACRNSASLLTVSTWLPPSTVQTETKVLHAPRSRQFRRWLLWIVRYSRRLMICITKRFRRLTKIVERHGSGWGGWRRNWKWSEGPEGRQEHWDRGREGQAWGQLLLKVIYYYYYYIEFYQPITYYYYYYFGQSNILYYYYFDQSNILYYILLFNWIL